MAHIYLASRKDGARTQVSYYPEHIQLHLAERQRQAEGPVWMNGMK